MFFVSEYEFLKHIPFTLDMNFNRDFWSDIMQLQGITLQPL